MTNTTWLLRHHATIQLHLLTTLRDHGPQTARQLAERLAPYPSGHAVGSHLRELARDHMVERAGNTTPAVWRLYAEHCAGLLPPGYWPEERWDEDGCEKVLDIPSNLR
jgi:hypothetical protein